ncbi:MAG: hypothetical protein ACLRL6_00950 [Clostridium sp.]
MKTLSFLVKPVSAGCQLNCTYCFYKDIAENRSRANYGRMRNEVAVALLEKVFQLRMRMPISPSPFRAESRCLPDCPSMSSLRMP